MSNQKDNQKEGNPLVTGAVLAGVAITAAVLSKKENRDKAGKMITDAAKGAEKIIKKPEVKAAIEAATGKTAKEDSQKA